MIPGKKLEISSHLQSFGTDFDELPLFSSKTTHRQILSNAETQATDCRIDTFKL